MSAEGMVEEPRAELPDGPGYRLRALRESRELSLPRAAVMLHLDESTLEALESEIRLRADRIPDSPFPYQFFVYLLRRLALIQKFQGNTALVLSRWRPHLIIREDINNLLITVKGARKITLSKVCFAQPIVI